MLVNHYFSIALVNSTTSAHTFATIIKFDLKILLSFVLSCGALPEADVTNSLFSLVKLNEELKILVLEVTLDILNIYVVFMTKYIIFEISMTSTHFESNL